MPQSAQIDPPETLHKTLRMKLTVIILCSFVGFALLSIGFNFFFESYVLFYALTILLMVIVVAGITTLLLWKFLHPLDDLMMAAYLFAKGQFQHRLTIRTNDEFQEIGSTLNLMAQNIADIVGKTSLEKDVTAVQMTKFASVISSLPEGLIVLDLNRKVFYANKAAETLCGYAFEEMRGRSIDELIHIQDSVGQEIPPLDYAPVTHDEKAQTLVFNEKTLVLRGKAGQSSYILLTSSPIQSTVQTDLGRVLIMRNVDKQHELESMQLDFVSMASHELRTPLTSIKGYLSVFLSENKDKLTNDQKEFLDRIMISTQQLASLVENLLSVSKVERGAFSINAQSLDWMKVLKQAVTDGQLQAAQKNITLTLDVPPTLPPVSADAIRIAEVINNLINNAVNYTQEGGKIVVSAKVDGEMVVTSVTDNGRGISKEGLAHLFTKFFRIQGALDTSSNSKGTGLGLFLSKSIVDLHHGKIWAESPGPGQGTTFSFTLPIAKDTNLKSTLASLNIPIRL